MAHIDVDGVVGDVHLIVEAIDAVHVVVAVVVLKNKLYQFKKRRILLENQLQYFIFRAILTFISTTFLCM